MLSRVSTVRCASLRRSEWQPAARGPNLQRQIDAQHTGSRERHLAGRAQRPTTSVAVEVVGDLAQHERVGHGGTRCAANGTSMRTSTVAEACAGIVARLALCLRRRRCRRHSDGSGRYGSATRTSSDCRHTSTSRRPSGQARSIRPSMHPGVIDRRLEVPQQRQGQTAPTHDQEEHRHELPGPEQRRRMVAHPVPRRWDRYHRLTGGSSESDIRQHNPADPETCRPQGVRPPASDAPRTDSPNGRRPRTSALEDDERGAQAFGLLLDG